MNNKDILEILKSINYESKEIEELEEKALSEKNSIGEDLYNIQNDEVLRGIAFRTLEQKVKANLKEDEKIIYKSILLQSYLEKEIFQRYVGVAGGKSPIYIGLFITNKRLFAFKMGTIYELLDEYSNDLANLSSFSDLWEECDTIGFKFNDDKEILPRPVGEENKKLFLAMIKNLKEDLNLEIREYEKPKYSKVELIFCIVGTILILSFFIPVIILTIGDIIKALK